MSHAVVDYLRVFFPTRYKVCGVYLKPLSIGHLLTFEQYGLGFRLSNPDIDEKQRFWNFVVAYMICSRDWQENQDLWNLNVEDTTAWKKVYDETVKHIEQHSSDEEYIKFLGYLKSHLQNWPETYLDDSQKKWIKPEKERGSPYLMSILTAVLTTFNDGILNMFNVTTPMDIPYDSIVWLLTVRSEQEGKTNIDSTFDGEDGQVLLKNIQRITSIADPAEREKAFMETDLNKVMEIK